MTIDWTKPIEAYHEDGRVVPVELDAQAAQPDDEGDYRITPWLDDWLMFFSSTGESVEGWRIRNRAPEPAPDTLTLRDQFAMAALTGDIVARKPNPVFDAEAVAKRAYQFADAMLAERNREREA